MKDFVELYKEVDGTTSTNNKVKAFVDFLKQASDDDKLWAIALFTHRRPRRTIQVSFLRMWAAELAGLPQWLFEESYHVVGDLAETISLVLPEPENESDRKLSEWIDLIIKQKNTSDQEKKNFILSAWKSLDKDARFLFNKIITGGFRLGMSDKLVIRAVSLYLGKDPSKIAHRLMGDWSPQKITFSELLLTDDWQDDLSKPYPFFLAYALDIDLGSLGDPSEWHAEWKWDGIRAQLIKRQHTLFLWTRGEELVTSKYPEFHQLAELVHKSFVIDGELLVSRNGQLGHFHELQKRIGRKSPGKKILESHPVVIKAYDLLEYEGKDLRNQSFSYRRNVLNEFIQELPDEVNSLLTFSEEVDFETWAELSARRENARVNLAEGLMLKHISSPYRDGRRRGDWWKWKLDPFTVDAVMLYAQRGHGRRSGLYTDFTFAVWDYEGKLVPFAKAYSGLTNKEFAEVTRFVQRNTLERFGPVRSVKPELVFEVAFEGIQPSNRHKSGIALRFPRIKRWRKDKKPMDANTLEDLKALMASYG